VRRHAQLPDLHSAATRPLQHAASCRSTWCPLPSLHSFKQNGETAPDPLPEEKDNINGMQQLSMEATSVNQAFREQVGGCSASVWRIN